MNPKSPGQASFEAYNSHGANPGKTYDGKPVPTWKNLSDDVRAKWAAAELAAGRLRLGQFPPTAHIEDSHVFDAFKRARAHHNEACATESAPLSTRLLLEGFEDELRQLEAKRPPH
jgi:hypothetical protein